MNIWKYSSTSNIYLNEQFMFTTTTTTTTTTTSYYNLLEVIPLQIDRVVINLQILMIWAVRWYLVRSRLQQAMIQRLSNHATNSVSIYIFHLVFTLKTWIKLIYDAPNSFKYIYD